MQLVEPLHLVFHGMELDQTGLNLLNAGGIRTEIVVPAQFEELRQRFVCRIEVV